MKIRLSIPILSYITRPNSQSIIIWSIVTIESIEEIESGKDRIIENGLSEISFVVNRVLIIIRIILLILVKLLIEGNQSVCFIVNQIRSYTIIERQVNNLMLVKYRFRLYLVILNMLLNTLVIDSILLCNILLMLI